MVKKIKTKAEKEINCSCCGYDTCKEMAIAIFNEFNHKENCIYYLKKEVEVEKEQERQDVDLQLLQMR